MNEVVGQLTTSLNATSLWGVVGSVVPLITVSILFGMGFYLVKRVLNKTKRFKGGA